MYQYPIMLTYVMLVYYTIIDILHFVLAYNIPQRISSLPSEQSETPSHRDVRIKQVLSLHRNAFHLGQTIIVKKSYDVLLNVFSSFY